MKSKAWSKGMIDKLHVLTGLSEKQISKWQWDQIHKENNPPSKKYQKPVVKNKSGRQRMMNNNLKPEVSLKLEKLLQHKDDFNQPSTGYHDNFLAPRLAVAHLPLLGGS